MALFGVLRLVRCPFAGRLPLDEVHDGHGAFAIMALAGGDQSARYSKRNCLTDLIFVT